VRTAAGKMALPLVPFVLAVLVGIRSSFGPGVTVGLLLALALLPVWFSSLSAYRWVRGWMGLGLLAVAAGVLLTWLDGFRPRDDSLLVSQSLLLLALLGCIGVLLWARAQMGAAKMAMAFSLGLLASTAISGPEGANVWKFGWSVPTYLLVLSLAMWSGRRVIELTAVFGLALTTVITDSRSVTSFLILSAALVIWQMRPTSGPRRPRTWGTIAGMALMAVAAYFAIQSLIYEGVFGEAALERSRMQIETSGSLIAGGRPELGATIALLQQYPFGFGSGVVPTAGDVWVAKSGMAALNYNPDNGYVEIFMFGGHFEVHSVIGDLWLVFGLPGGILGFIALGACVYGLARLIARREASALTIFVTVFSIWNMLFAPLLSSYRLLALALALVAIEATRSPRSDALTIAHLPANGSAARLRRRSR